MSLPTFNTKSPTIKRILKEAAELSTNPDPTLHAAPLETNLFEWHFTLRGPPSTPYASGAYHGRIVLPQQYPLRPPSFRFLTPSGRFEVNREICLSISGHHEETWQPAWGIRTALWALRAFMEGGAKGQVGGMEMGEAERRRLAEESQGWKCNGCGGRSNEDILRAQKDEAGGRSETGRAVVPDDLRFGFKDEMQKEPHTDPSGTASPTGQDVQEPSVTSKNPRTPLTTVGSSDQDQEVNRPEQVNQGQASPLLNLQPPTLQRHAHAPVMNQASPQDAVPPWIDKAIVGLVATLIVMVIKKFAV